MKHFLILGSLLILDQETMQVNISFTLTPGREGWKFPPIEFSKLYSLKQDTDLDSIKTILQNLMMNFESTLKPYRRITGEELEDLAVKALQAVSTQPQLLTHGDK